ncbi:MAG: ABC transporter ATP-binding protein [Halorhabdus sp.]
MAAIDVRDLAKHFGDVRAVDGISFTVEDGEVFGYLGPNGAGKTTTIRTLLGFLEPTAGGGTVLGADITDERALVDAKRRLGYLPSDPVFDEGVTGREILDLHGSIKGADRRAELLDLFDPPLDRTVREYSSGNVQKLGIVQAFMHDPDLVIMDEPTRGLDPLMQQRFNDFVRQERDRGVTIFFSSHVLSEVRRVCDRVAILRDGTLVTTERVESLLGRSGKVVRARLLVPEDAGLADPTFGLDGVHDPTVSTVDVSEGVTGPQEGTPMDVTFTYTGDVNSLLAALSEYHLLDLDLEEAPLEDIFMRFYGPDAGTVDGNPTPAVTDPSGGTQDV